MTTAAMKNGSVDDDDVDSDNTNNNVNNVNNVDDDNDDNDDIVIIMYYLTKNGKKIRISLASLSPFPANDDSWETSIRR